MGFGASPLASPETRRSYAAAGLSPLGTQDRERIAAGAGISPMAGPIETDAWKMTQYMMGQREQAPVSYGGIGERPRGESRRAIRMQAEWDKQRARQLQEQQAIRSMEAMDFEQNLKLRNQELQEEQVGWRREAEWSRQNVEHRTNQHVTGFLRGIRGGYDEMGNAIPELDPESPDYEVRRKNLLRDYPLAAQHPEIQPILGAMDQIFSTRKAAEEDRIKEASTSEKQDRDWRVQQEAMATELGISVDEFTDAETGELNRIGLMQRVGEVRRERAEEAERAAERKTLDKEKRDAAKPLIREIRDINDELEAAIVTAQASKGRVQQEALNSVKLLESRLSRRENELLTIVGTPEEDSQRPEISKEAVDAARKAIRDNPDSPQAQAARQIIEAYEASQPEPPTGEAGGGETISEPETIPTSTAAASSVQQPFLSQQERESIPQTRREFATGEMAENLDTMEEMKAELDRLFKIRFTSKDNTEKYKSLQKKLGEKRKEDTKLRAARRKEINEEMKKLGPYSSGENRKKYVALERELRLISGV